MMVMYLPVKFEFDWTKRVRVKSPEMEMLTNKRTDRITPISKGTKMWTNRRMDRQTNGRNYTKEPSYDGDLYPCQV